MQCEIRGSFAIKKTVLQQILQFRKFEIVFNLKKLFNIYGNVHQAQKKISGYKYF